MQRNAEIKSLLLHLLLLLLLLLLRLLLLVLVVLLLSSVVIHETAHKADVTKRLCLATSSRIGEANAIGIQQHHMDVGPEDSQCKPEMATPAAEVDRDLPWAEKCRGLTDVTEGKCQMSICGLGMRGERGGMRGERGLRGERGHA